MKLFHTNNCLTGQQFIDSNYILNLDVKVLMFFVLATSEGFFFNLKPKKQISNFVLRSNHRR